MTYGGPNILDDSKEKKPQELVLEQLGMECRSSIEQMKSSSNNKIIKVVSASEYIKGNYGSGRDSKMINMTLVLRQSGIVDVYSDFELVETVVRWEKDLFCTDIQCDSEFFYLHFRRVRLEAGEEMKQVEENQEEDSSDDDDDENDEGNTIVYRISH